jgi:hypothetical protein
MASFQEEFELFGFLMELKAHYLLISLVFSRKYFFGNVF